MIITKKGYNVKKKDKPKYFICDICKCEWIALKDEYEEDWSKPSIPAYCKCPCCGSVMYDVESIIGEKRGRK